MNSNNVPEQVLPEVILEQPCCKVPIGYNGTLQIQPPNCPFSFDCNPLSNTPVIQPTPLTIPNGTHIHSAVLPQFTLRTDLQTDRRPTDMFCSVSHTIHLRSPDTERRG